MIDYGLNQNVRNMIVGVDAKVPLSNGSYVTAVNFDNAASTPPFYSVMKEVNDFMPWYSSVHRGTGYKSILSTKVYEEGRKIISNFVNADIERDIVIYTKNTTESINILAYLLAGKDKESVVLSTCMEHLANDLPWRDKFTVDYVDIDEYGKLRMDDLESKLQKYRGRLKLVTVTGASNVTGYVNPIHDIARLVHLYGSKILVDGAQMVPHLPVDMKPFGTPEHIDYLAFSAHKMYAPFGIGALIGPKATFEKSEPVYKGGGDVNLVTHQFILWDESPARDEAGSPNVIGVAALNAAIRTLNSIGMKTIEAYENNLINYALDKIRRIPEIKVYTNSQNTDKKVSIIPFNINGMSHEMVAKILSAEDGIAVRHGLFCAHPYCERLLGYTESELNRIKKHGNAPFLGMIRISLGMYNNYQEVDRLINTLNRIVMNKQYYLSKYHNGK